MNEFIFNERVPSVEEYNQLRREVNWHVLSQERAEKGLANSLYTICVDLEDKLIAFGRIVGDGQIYFYLQDLMVSPEYQHHGLGGEVMERLMVYINDHAPMKTGAYVGLMMAPGLHDFYEKYGFKDLPEDSPAMGMWRNGH